MAAEEEVNTAYIPSAYELRERMFKLMNLMWEPGKCKFCGQPIWWTITRGGKKMPVSREFLPHFADCPEYKR